MAADTQNRASRRPQGRLIGYARVSTDEQTTEAQEMELRAAGCETIVQEHSSGASRARPALAKLVREIAAGDTLVVVRLDRLARSVSHLLEVIEDLTARTAHFRSLQDPIDTKTPQGMFSLQVLGAVAQLERALISERTKAGIRAAKAKGKLPGNPGIRERRPEALAKVPENRLMTLVAGIHASNPKLTLREIADQLERLHERTPRGGSKWSPSSVKNLIDRAGRSGLITDSAANANAGASSG
jgi:DNA invertase Pin-like site-specific DNA recombinase